jgi:hypothetical protein
MIFIFYFTLHKRGCTLYAACILNSVTPTLCHTICYSDKRVIETHSACCQFQNFFNTAVSSLDRDPITYTALTITFYVPRVCYWTESSELYVLSCESDLNYIKFQNKQSQRYTTQNVCVERKSMYRLLTNFYIY